MRTEKQSYNELHKIWDSAHFGGSPTYMVRKKILIREIDKILKGKGRKLSVLDIGCGTGDYIKPFKRYDVEYLGLDLSDYAIKKLSREYPKMKFLCGDIFKINLEKEFDLIFLSEVLEHITQEGELVRKLNKHLKKEGSLVLSVPFDPKLWSYSDEQAHHKRRYTKNSLRSVLEKEGFKDIKLICYGFPMLRLYWILTKKFRKRIQTSTKKQKGIFLFVNKLFLVDLISTKTNLGIGLIAISKK